MDVLCNHKVHNMTSHTIQIRNSTTSYITLYKCSGNAEESGMAGTRERRMKDIKGLSRMANNNMKI